MKKLIFVFAFLFSLFCPWQQKAEAVYSATGNLDIETAVVSDSVFILVQEADLGIFEIVKEFNAGSYTRRVQMTSNSIDKLNNPTYSYVSSANNWIRNKVPGHGGLFCVKKPKTATTTTYNLSSTLSDGKTSLITRNGWIGSVGEYISGFNCYVYGTDIYFSNSSAEYRRLGEVTGYITLTGSY